MAKTKQVSSSNIIISSILGGKVYDEAALTFSLTGSSNASVAQTRWNSDSQKYGLPGTLDLDAFLQNDNLLYSTINAIASIDDVSDISISQASSYQDADLTFTGIEDMSSVANGAGTFPGSESDPNDPSDYESHIYIETDDDWWIAGSISGEAEIGAGSSLDWLLLHEALHGLGLGHTHDQGNGSTSNIATSPLDNQRYTAMSYNAGDYNDVSRSDMKSPTLGFAVTPMALDIAALQEAYGVDDQKHKSDTSYILTDARSSTLDVSAGDGIIGDGIVSIGEAFYSIWDAGNMNGLDDIDEIAYSGTQNSIINLNAATLSVQPNADIESIISDLSADGVFDALPEAIAVEYLGHPGTAGYKAANYYAGGFFSRVFNDAGDVQQGGYSIANGVIIENAVGGDGLDILIGNSHNNDLFGGMGENVIHGGAGIDTARYEPGALSLVIARTSETAPLFVESFNFDPITESGDYPSILGGSDIGEILDSLYGMEKIETGDGDDTIFIRGYGAWSGDQETGNLVEIYSGSGSDFVEGSDARDRIFGGKGADWLYGHEDAAEGFSSMPENGIYDGDTIHGGEGDDHIFGYEAEDSLFGDNGKDFIRGNSGADDISGGLDADMIEGGYHEDTISGDDGDDILWGFESSESLVDMELATNAAKFREIGAFNYSGEWNANVIDGGSGNDYLIGSGGDDTLSGGADDDVLYGDHGSDMLTGGSGSDVFVFHGNWANTLGGSGSGDDDYILDFNSADDQILLSKPQTLNNDPNSPWYQDPSDPYYTGFGWEFEADRIVFTYQEASWDSNGEKIWIDREGAALHLNDSYDMSDIYYVDDFAFA
jgi:hypothetical protein